MANSTGPIGPGPGPGPGPIGPVGDVHVSLAGRGDLAARIYRQLLDAIVDGRLRAGERLPPTREMARRLDVSRNTVAVAYERLTAEGFLVGRVGAGTYVARSVEGADGLVEGADRLVEGATVRRRRRPEPRGAPAGSGIHPRKLWRTFPVPPTAARVEPEFDFSVGEPDPRLFPLETWRRLVGRELRGTTVHSAQYGNPSGHEGLRAAIARSVGISRAIRAHADDVIVTHGAQQALDLIGRVLIEPGACVAVEEPGYPPARMLFRSHGARVVGVPVDGDGLDVAALPPSARLVYVTPSHQFPLGTPMSLARRAALLAWAERHDAVVIEDDYDSEFRFSDRPLDPLQSIDRTGRVVYVGSFSKTLLPMLRLGFLVAPASLQPALRTAKQLTDWHGELPTQAALARVIDEGLLARHIRKATRVYSVRHGQIVETLGRDLTERLRVVPSAAGLHVCTRPTSNDIDLTDLERRAARLGVAVRTLAAFCGEEPAQSGLVIGYGAIPTDRIAEGLRRLAAAVEGGAPY